MGKSPCLIICLLTESTNKNVESTQALLPLSLTTRSPHLLSVILQPSFLLNRLPPRVLNPSSTPSPPLPLTPTTQTFRPPRLNTTTHTLEHNKGRYNVPYLVRINILISSFDLFDLFLAHNHSDFRVQPHRHLATTTTKPKPTTTQSGMQSSSFFPLSYPPSLFISSYPKVEVQFPRFLSFAPKGQPLRISSISSFALQLKLRSSPVATSASAGGGLTSIFIFPPPHFSSISCHFSSLP